MPKPLRRRDMLAVAPLLAAPAAAAEDRSNSLQTVRGRISPDKGRFMMPAHFGPLPNPDPAQFKLTAGAGTLYRDVSQIFVTYLTDARLLSRFLPEPYELSGEPLVTVNYSQNRGIEWLAGGSYNIIGVYVPATYRGKQDQVSGSYAMVLWENLTDPILTGHKAQGIPKIFGDVEDHQVSADSWRTSLARNGHKILDVRASAMRPLTPAQLSELEKQFRNSQMLGWKYVPNETFTAAVVSYATAFPTSMSFRQAWTAQGSVEWHSQTWSQNPTQSHIVNAMRSLPVKEIRSCLVTEGERQAAQLRCAADDIRRRKTHAGTQTVSRVRLGGNGRRADRPPAKTITLRDTIPTTSFGKTGLTLPQLAFGGSAMVERWSPGYGLKALSFDRRVAMVRHGYESGIRYFDTARNYSESESIYGAALHDVRQNIYLATKVGVKAEDKGFVEPSGVRQSIEDSLKALKTDHVDVIQLHGPLFEYLGFDAAMRIYEQLDKLRGEKLFRYIGVTGHTAFEPMYRLIDTKLFDQVLLAYGYFPKGMNTILSQANLQWRELCLARARELGMGVVAMKVMGSFLFGHNAPNIVPGFGDERYKALRRAALRWALRDKKPDVLNIGVSLPSDLDDNIETLRHAPAFTRDNQKILADFSVKALGSKAVKEMKTT